MNNGDAPVTKRDLEELEKRFEQLEEKLEGVESRFSEKLERAVTTLLSGFYAYARTADARDAGLEVRVARVEERLIDLEEHRRRNLN